MKIQLWLLLLLSLLFLISCKEQEKISELESKLTALSEKVDSISENLNSFRTDMFERDFNEVGKWALLSIDGEGYQTIKTNVGLIVAVSVEKVEEYLNGIKVKLNIGNPNYSDFAGGEILFQWGLGLYTKNHKFTKEIRKGKWNIVDAVLTPFDIENNKYFSLSINLDRLWFFK